MNFNTLSTDQSTGNSAPESLVTSGRQSPSRPRGSVTQISSQADQSEVKKWKLWSRLRRLLNANNRVHEDDETGGAEKDTGEPSRQAQGPSLDLIPPVPRFTETAAERLHPSQLQFVGTRDKTKSAAPAFPNAVFQGHASHRRDVHKLPRLDELSHHADPYYQHHHLTIVKGLNLSGGGDTKAQQSVSRGHHRHHHRSHKEACVVPTDEVLHESAVGRQLDTLGEAQAGGSGGMHGLHFIHRDRDGQKSTQQPISVDVSQGHSDRSTRPANSERPASGEVQAVDQSVRRVGANVGHFCVEVTATKADAGAGRSRLKSENFVGASAKLHREDSLRSELPTTTSHALSGSSSSTVSKPHAHTVTGGSGQAMWLLRRLALYSSTDSHKHGFVRDKSGGQIGSESGLLPDPSKLPKEEACSNSLEFTKARLKNPNKISSKFQVRSAFDVRHRKRTKSLNSSGASSDQPRTGHLRFLDPPPRPFLLEDLSRSDEALLPNSAQGTSTSRLSSATDSQNELTGSSARHLPYPAKETNTRSTGRHDSHGHHKHRVHFGSHHGQGHCQGHAHHHGHHHHYHHHHHHHHSHRHGHHHTGKAMSHSMTRVTESRRYLTFTRYLPLWSARQFMEAHGSLLGESETYAVLFHHTSCYDIMPGNAKLIIIDGQLSITQAFKALIYNGIRAAPVWNSALQTFSYMLTVTDFVDILNLCWRKLNNPDETAVGLDFDRLDRLTVHQWKNMIVKSFRLNPIQQDDSELSVSSSSTFRTRSCLLDGTLSEKAAQKSPSKYPRSRSASLQLSISPIRAPDSLAGSSSAGSSSSSSASSVASSASQSTTSSNPSTSGSRSSITSLPPNFRLPRDLTPRSQVNCPLTTTKPSARSRQGYCLVTASPCDSLFRALDTLTRFRIHHLPILESPLLSTGNCLQVVTQRALLSYLYGKIPHLPQPRFLQSSIAELNVGTFSRVSVIPLKAPLADALLLFQQRRVSALPVVETLENRRLINLFSKYDVITMVLQGAHLKPNQTVQEWLEICKATQAPTDTQSHRPPVEVCLASSNLYSVIQKLVRTGFRRLVIVKDTQTYRVDGIVSLSDVLKFAVLQQVRSSMLSLGGVGQHPGSNRRPPSVAEVADESEEVEAEEGKKAEACGDEKATVGNRVICVRTEEMDKTNAQT